jgi:hypothetical protein
MPLQKEAMVSVVVLLDRVPCNTARVFFLYYLGHKRFGVP